jgi:hypothetical protein
MLDTHASTRIPKSATCLIAVRQVNAKACILSEASTTLRNNFQTFVTLYRDFVKETAM